MGRFAKRPESNFECAPAGTHTAVCYSIIDLGRQDGEFDGKPTSRSVILVQWELGDAVRENGEPFTIGRFYTNSLSEKANLRRDLEAWRGRAFSDVELKRFDLNNLLGKPCLLNILQNGEKPMVAAVMALPKDATPPKGRLAQRTLFLEEWNQQVFKSLPEGLQKLIQKSDEYRSMNAGFESEPSESVFEEASGGGIGQDDEIPF